MKRVSRLVAMVVLGLGVLVGTAGVADAQVYTGGTPPVVGGADVDVLGVQGFRSPAPVSGRQLTVLSTGARLAQQPARVGGLALTGSDIAGLAGLAFAAIAIGAVAVRIGRPAERS